MLSNRMRMLSNQTRKLSTQMRLLSFRKLFSYAIFLSFQKKVLLLQMEIY